MAIVFYTTNFNDLIEYINNLIVYTHTIKISEVICAMRSVLRIVNKRKDIFAIYNQVVR